MHFQSLTNIARELREGQCSSLELTQYMLQRIAELNPRLHCYSEVTASLALEQATHLDKLRADGKALGPLHGVPIAIKDLLATAGVVTASGTRVMRDHIPREDATVVARLREAGAVILGKVQLTEGAYGNHHPDIAAPVNPWGEQLWSGVSSSGSGVSVAAGLAFGALGSDTGGSIRFPSAANQLVGIKPTYGRTSRHGAFPLAESLDHIGPMARSVDDAARLLQVIAGYDRRDANSINATVPDYLQALAPAGAALADLTIAVDWQFATTGVATKVVATLRKAMNALIGLGAKVVEVTVPKEYPLLVNNWVITCAAECAHAHEELFARYKSQYGPDLTHLIELGNRCSAIQYSRLERLRERFASGMDQLFEGVDLLLCPTIPTDAPTNQQMATRAIEGDAAADFLSFTAPFNYSGHPTITLPAGLDPAGLPTSFQLVGGRLCEATLLRVGAAYEQVRGPIEYPAL